QASGTNLQDLLEVLSATTTRDSDISLNSALESRDAFDALLDTEHYKTVHSNFECKYPKDSKLRAEKLNTLEMSIVSERKMMLDTTCSFVLSMKFENDSFL
ncbi:hypothetical protein L9F63_023796, partial [Diploptera punctata]